MTSLTTQQRVILRNYRNNLMKFVNRGILDYHFGVHNVKPATCEIPAHKRRAIYHEIAMLSHQIGERDTYEEYIHKYSMS